MWVKVHRGFKSHRHRQLGVLETEGSRVQTPRQMPKRLLVRGFALFGPGCRGGPGLELPVARLKVVPAATWGRRRTPARRAAQLDRRGVKSPG